VVTKRGVDWLNSKVKELTGLETVKKGDKGLKELKVGETPSLPLCQWLQRDH